MIIIRKKHDSIRVKIKAVDNIRWKIKPLNKGNKVKNAQDALKLNKIQHFKRSAAGLYQESHSRLKCRDQVSAFF